MAKVFEIFFNFSDTLYTRVFGTADYKYEINFFKFKMAKPRGQTSYRKFHQFFRYFVLSGFWRRWLRIWKWRSSNQKFHQYLWNIVSGGFRDYWLWIWNQILKVQNVGSNMAEVYSKFSLISLILCTQGSWLGIK